MNQRKVCLLGSFAVGKTSLVRRFVHGIFSEEYQSTIGVKIDRKTVAHKDQDLELLIWDLHGDDEFQRLQDSYLSGMSAYFLVIDRTRIPTVERAVAIAEQARRVEPDAPSVLLVNKADLDSDWRLDGPAYQSLAKDRPVFHTSAKTGDNVEQAFQELAKLSLCDS